MITKYQSQIVLVCSSYPNHSTELLRWWNLQRPPALQLAMPCLSVKSSSGAVVIIHATCCLVLSFSQAKPLPPMGSVTYILYLSHRLRILNDRTSSIIESSFSCEPWATCNYTYIYIYIWYYIRAKQVNRLRSSKKSECLLTPHHFHIHILRHPLLLQLCKNYLRKSQLNIQKVVICKVLNITLLRALYIWWSIAGSSIFGWPSLLRKSSVELQVLLLQKKDVLGLNEELTQCERLRTHFCRSNPIKSCRPMRANTLRQNTVKIITSASFFTDWIRAPTMVFRPCVCVWGGNNMYWLYDTITETFVNNI